MSVGVSVRLSVWDWPALWSYVAQNNVLSSWLDSPMFWAPWHQSLLASVFFHFHLEQRRTLTSASRAVSAVAELLIIGITKLRLLKWFCERWSVSSLSKSDFVMLLAIYRQNVLKWNSAHRYCIHWALHAHYDPVLLRRRMFTYILQQFVTRYKTGNV